MEFVPITFFISAAILFLIFLALRELMCWYYKINDILSTLKSINYKLDRLSIGNSKAAPKQSTINETNNEEHPIQYKEITTKQRLLRLALIIISIATLIFLLIYAK